MHDFIFVASNRIMTGEVGLNEKNPNHPRPTLSARTNRTNSSNSETLVLGQSNPKAPNKHL